MSKVKYYYDSDTLSYKKVALKKGRTLGFVDTSRAISGTGIVTNEVAV